MSCPSPSVFVATDLLILLRSDSRFLHSFVHLFKIRFPDVSVVKHIPTCIADGLDEMAFEFASGLTKLLVVCDPESWPVEILKARELAGQTELRVCQIFLSVQDLFVHSESGEIHDEFVWVSPDELHLFTEQIQPPQTLDEFVTSIEL